MVQNMIYIVGVVRVRNHFTLAGFAEEYPGMKPTHIRLSRWGNCSVGDGKIRAVCQLGGEFAYRSK